MLDLTQFQKIILTCNLGLVWHKIVHSISELIEEIATKVLDGGGEGFKIECFETGVTKVDGFFTLMGPSWSSSFFRFILCLLSFPNSFFHSFISFLRYFSDSDFSLRSLLQLVSN